MPGVGRDTQRHSMSPHHVAGGPAGAFELRYLEILHRLECIEEPAFVRVDVQAARLQGPGGSSCVASMVERHHG